MPGGSKSIIDSLLGQEMRSVIVINEPQNTVIYVFIFFALDNISHIACFPECQCVGFE